MFSALIFLTTLILQVTVQVHPEPEWLQTGAAWDRLLGQYMYKFLGLYQEISTCAMRVTFQAVSSINCDRK